MAKPDVREVKIRLTPGEHERAREGMLRWALDTGEDATWQAYLSWLIERDAGRRAAA